MIQEVKHKIILKDGREFWSDEVVKLIELKDHWHTEDEVEHIGKITEADDMWVRLDCSRLYTSKTIRVLCSNVLSIEKHN